MTILAGGHDGRDVAKPVLLPPRPGTIIIPPRLGTLTAGGSKVTLV